jgi:hypothetical protein
MRLQSGFFVLAHIENVVVKIYENCSVISDIERKRVMMIFAEEIRKRKVQILKLASNERLKNIELDSKFYELFKNALSYITSSGKELHKVSQKDFFSYALQVEKNTIEIYTALLQQCHNEDFDHILLEDMIHSEQKHMFFILDQLHEYNDLEYQTKQ